LGSGGLDKLEKIAAAFSNINLIKTNEFSTWTHFSKNLFLKIISPDSKFVFAKTSIGFTFLFLRCSFRCFFALRKIFLNVKLFGAVDFKEYGQAGRAYKYKNIRFQSLIVIPDCMFLYKCFGLICNEHWLITVLCVIHCCKIVTRRVMVVISFL